MSIQITQLPSGSIEIIDTEESINGQVKEFGDISYERSEIPQSLIDDCNNLHLETGEIHFIFDNYVSNKLKSRYTSKEEKRDINLSELLSSDKYHVGNELYFREIPSRFSYYDSETKLSDRYKRYNELVNFFKRLSFTPSDFNLGPEYEQSYTLTIIENNELLQKYILRIRPNLFISLSDNSNSNIDLFFNKSKIFDFIKKTSGENYKSIIRDIKIEEILKNK